jgi:hypothetical protein
MSTLPFPELEHLYDELAAAIDTAGPEQASVLLAKLVLSMAHEWGDGPRVLQLLRHCQHEPVIARSATQRLI